MELDINFLKEIAIKVFEAVNATSVTVNANNIVFDNLILTSYVYDFTDSRILYQNTGGPLDLTFSGENKVYYIWRTNTETTNAQAETQRVCRSW